MTTNNDGLGPGLTSNDIKTFDECPVLIEARLSKEGLLSFDSILEESQVRCMESVMDSRVACFESLVADWGPECSHATKGCKIYSKDVGDNVPWVSTFNVPLLESIASGHFFDRTFAPVDEDIHKVREDNERCKELLDQWKSLFSANYKNMAPGATLVSEVPDATVSHRRNSGCLRNGSISGPESPEQSAFARLYWRFWLTLPGIQIHIKV